MGSPRHATLQSQSTVSHMAEERSLGTAEGVSTHLLCAVTPDMPPVCIGSSRTRQGVRRLDMRLGSNEQAKCVQEAQEAHLQKELSDGLLCAVINNNTRCYNESTEFADHLDDTLAPPYKVRSMYKAALACAVSNSCAAHTKSPCGMSNDGECLSLHLRCGVGVHCTGPSRC